MWFETDIGAESDIDIKNTMALVHVFGSVMDEAASGWIRECRLWTGPNSTQLHVKMASGTVLNQDTRVPPVLDGSGMKMRYKKGSRKCDVVVGSDTDRLENMKRVFSDDRTTNILFTKVFKDGRCCVMECGQGTMVMAAQKQAISPKQFTTQCVEACGRLVIKDVAMPWISLSKMMYNEDSIRVVDPSAVVFIEKTTGAVDQVVGAVERPVTKHYKLDCPVMLMMQTFYGMLVSVLEYYGRYKEDESMVLFVNRRLHTQNVETDARGRDVFHKDHVFYQYVTSTPNVPHHVVVAVHRFERLLAKLPLHWQETIQMYPRLFDRVKAGESDGTVVQATRERYLQLYQTVRNGIAEALGDYFQDKTGPEREGVMFGIPMDDINGKMLVNSTVRVVHGEDKHAVYVRDSEGSYVTSEACVEIGEVCESKTSDKKYVVRRAWNAGSIEQGGGSKKEVLPVLYTKRYADGMCVSVYPEKTAAVCAAMREVPLSVYVKFVVDAVVDLVRNSCVAMNVALETTYCSMHEGKMRFRLGGCADILRLEMMRPQTVIRANTPMGTVDLRDPIMGMQQTVYASMVSMVHYCALYGGNTKLWDALESATQQGKKAQAFTKEHPFYVLVTTSVELPESMRQMVERLRVLSEEVVRGEVRGNDPGKMTGYQSRIEAVLRGEGRAMPRTEPLSNREKKTPEKEVRYRLKRATINSAPMPGGYRSIVDEMIRRNTVSDAQVLRRSGTND
jgi:hypothetical protein